MESLFAERIQTGNIDILEGATIGGFEIGQVRIGNKVDNPAEASFGNLAIYKDFFRVGGNNGYAMLGDNVIPASAGGAFNATGRIVNNTPNTGTQWGFDTSNYGLFIDVTNGTKNFGILSNAPLNAPAYVKTKVGRVLLSGSTYTMDLSQNDLFIFNSNGNYDVGLPTEAQVARQFSMETPLPKNFCTRFTIKFMGRGRANFQDIYDFNGRITNYSLENGDVLELIAIKKNPSNFEYHVIDYRN